MFLGVLSHLTLDEIYSVEWAGGRWRFKKSFGTALKLWGDSRWANFSTYSKLVLVVMMILSEPMVMEQYGRPSPMEMAANGWQGLWTQQPDPNAPITAYPPGQFPPNGYPPNAAAQGYAYQPLPANSEVLDPYATQQVDRTIYDTARRLWRRVQGETK
jgi:hypothetical protein